MIQMTFCRLGSSSAAIAIASTIGGNARMMSIDRIATSSTQPPDVPGDGADRDPDDRPSVVAAIATVSEIRAP